MKGETVLFYTSISQTFIFNSTVYFKSKVLEKFAHILNYALQIDN